MCIRDRDVYEVAERMMLSGTGYRGDRVIGKDIALNDIVIAREGPLRVVRFKNFVNDEYPVSYTHLIRLLHLLKLL